MTVIRAIAPYVVQFIVVVLIGIIIVEALCRLGSLGRKP